MHSNKHLRYQNLSKKQYSKLDVSGSASFLLKKFLFYITFYAMPHTYVLRMREGLGF